MEIDADNLVAHNLGGRVAAAAHTNFLAGSADSTFWLVPFPLPEVKIKEL
jgi:hypothetical protein